MKVSEAKTKLCPYINSNCICGDCMAWVYTKTQREMTFEEKKRFEMYNKEMNSIIPTKLEDNFNGRVNFFERDKKDLAEKYSDVLLLNLESDEDEKEGYCKRIDK